MTEGRLIVHIQQRGQGELDTKGIFKMPPTIRKSLVHFRKAVPLMWSEEKPHWEGRALHWSPLPRALFPMAAPSLPSYLCTDVIFLMKPFLILLLENLTLKLLFHPHALCSLQHLSPCKLPIFFSFYLIPYKPHKSRDLCLVFITPGPRTMPVQRMAWKLSRESVSRGRCINCVIWKAR